MVLALEDKGFEVIFWDRKTYIHPKGSSFSLEKVIGVKKNKLYRLQFKLASAMLSIAAVIMEHSKCLGR